MIFNYIVRNFLHLFSSSSELLETLCTCVPFTIILSQLCASIIDLYSGNTSNSLVIDSAEINPVFDKPLLSLGILY